MGPPCIGLTLCTYRSCNHIGLSIIIRFSVVFIPFPSTDHLLLQWRRKEFESGGTNPAQSAGKKCFFGRAPPHFGPKSTLSRFGERFRDGQYSLVSFLFAVLLLTVPPCPAICESGGHVPQCPMESAPLYFRRS